MSRVPVASLDQIRSKIGEEVGVSGWLTVDQERIDAFAEATEDHQFIHVDPEAAAQSPFGGRFVLDCVEEKGGGQILLRHSVTVDIEGEDKPALSAQWLTLLFT